MLTQCSANLLNFTPVIVTTEQAYVAGLSLENARVGTCTIQFLIISVFTATSYPWIAEVQVTVTHGNPYQVTIINPPNPQISESNLITEVDVQLLDAAGNTVLSGVGTMQANFTTVTYILDQPDAVALSKNPSNESSFVLVPFSDITSRAVVAALAFPARGGYYYSFTISVGSNDAIGSSAIQY